MTPLSSSLLVTAFGRFSLSRHDLHRMFLSPYMQIFNMIMVDRHTSTHHLYISRYSLSIYLQISQKIIKISLCRTYQSAFLDGLLYFYLYSHTSYINVLHLHYTSRNDTINPISPDPLHVPGWCLSLYIIYPNDMFLLY